MRPGLEGWISVPKLFYPKTRRGDARVTGQTGASWGSFYFARLSPLVLQNCVDQFSGHASGCQAKIVEEVLGFDKSLSARRTNLRRPLGVCVEDIHVLFPGPLAQKILHFFPFKASEKVLGHRTGFKLGDRVMV